MGQDTDELTTTPADIEATRADLSRNLDELSDKVSPQRVVQRRKDAARRSVTSVRDKLMGSAQDAKAHLPSGSSSGTDPVGSVKSSAQAATGTLESATEGNPLTAGLVAFGAGMLIAALVPASSKETEAASRVVDAAKEHGQPLIDEAKSMGQDLGESASQAVQEVKAQAQDSAQTVKEEGQSSADQVKDQAKTS